MTDLSGQSLGRYHLIEQLGEGGMAVVYKAYDTRLEREVAIKVIRRGAFPPEILDAVLKRFEREAKSLARLSHPNIVKVYDYGEHEQSPFLVMEYLPGGTLKKLLGKPIPWQDAVRLLLPVASGLAYAHQRGILHRDIKPANILITESGEPMLSDFGIAKIFEGEQTTALTGSGMAIGTPEYMAPEQWTGKTSPQSDLYSLGVVLYEMVAGRKPYIADTPAAILLKQATEPLPRPSQFAPGLPESVEWVLIKSLAREPADRYADVNSLIAAMESLLPVQDVPPSPVQPVAPEPLPPSQVEPALDIPTEATMEDGGETVYTTVTPLPAATSPGTITAPRPSIRPLPMMIAASAGAMIMVVLAILGLSQARNWFAAQPPATATANSATRPAPTATLLPPKASVSPGSTPTAALASTNTPTAEPTLGVGSSFIREKDSMTMMYVPAGKFTLGNGASAFVISLNSFWIDQTEVTNAMYALCVQAGACKPPQSLRSLTRRSYYGNPEYNDYPVIYVDWFRSKAYCQWAGGRLLTDAEWEKAARGTDGRTFPWGEGISCSLSNYAIGCMGDTTVVRHYPSDKSPYGAYDMEGNVVEWVADWFSMSGGYYLQNPGDNPTGPISSDVRTVRGEGFDLDLNNRPANPTYARSETMPANATYSGGFRCAMDAQP